MTPQDLRILAYACALAGLACFLRPVLGRLRGGAEPGAAGRGGIPMLRWAGFGLTLLALFLQRMAAGA